jgi:uncharacterized protein
MSTTETAVAPETRDRSRNKSHGYIWYELMTPEPDGAKAFYEAVVPGWSIGERIPGDQDYRMIERSDGGFAGGVFGLTEDMRQHGARPIWMGYIGVDDVDGTVAQIEAKGGKVLLPAFDIPQGRIAMVVDPQGAPFYVMKPVPPEGSEKQESDLFSPTEEQRVGWNELSTSDATAALEFYTSLFGLEKGDVMPMGEAGDYQFINHRGQMIGAIFPAIAGAFKGEQPHWRYYIRVPSIAAAKAAAEQGGGTITVGPMEVPGGDHIVIGKDPQGAEFALVGKA